MKKSVVTVCIAAVLSLALLAGCAAQAPAPQEAPASSEAVDEEPEQAEEEPAEEAEISSAEEPENAEDAAQETPFDAYNDAIADYLLSEAGADYEPADASLPVIDIFKIDDEDPEDIKVWGRFWLMNYNLRGTTLMNRSGGEYPGRLGPQLWRHPALTAVYSPCQIERSSRSEPCPCPVKHTTCG